MKEKNNKINFFKKIYFSVCKIKKYGELSKQGFIKSTYYVMDLILILSVIYASVLTFQMKRNANGLQEYLEQNFPNLKYEEGVLISEEMERKILNHNLVEVNFGGQLIIDTTTDSETLINEYKNASEPSILLTSNKYITINSQGYVQEYDYKDIINEEQGQLTIGKEYFVNMFSNVSYSYYFFGFFIGSLIGISIIVFLYNLLISGIAFIICKIKKIKVKFGEIYNMGLYAQTISIFGYFIMNFIPATIGVYIQLISLFVSVGYLTSAIYMNKWVMPENN